jgi:hypothetical protein
VSPNMVVVEVMSSKSDLALHEVAEPQDRPTIPVLTVASCRKGLEGRYLEMRYGSSTGVKSEDDGGFRERS